MWSTLTLPPRLPVGELYFVNSEYNFYANMSPCMAFFKWGQTCQTKKINNWLLSYCQSMSLPSCFYFRWVTFEVMNAPEQEKYAAWEPVTVLQWLLFNNADWGMTECCLNVDRLKSVTHLTSMCAIASYWKISVSTPVLFSSLLFRS